MQPDFLVTACVAFCQTSPYNIVLSSIDSGTPRWHPYTAAISGDRLPGRMLSTGLASLSCLRGKTVIPCSRHGARTPLTDAYWEGATWDKGTDCGEAFEALKISVRDLDGGPRPPATHDAAQVSFLMIVHSMIGSCTWCEAPPGTVA